MGELIKQKETVICDDCITAACDTRAGLMGTMEDERQLLEQICLNIGKEIPDQLLEEVQYNNVH